MELVVTHLTRMQPGYVCVAGIEPASNRQIRPVTPHARLPQSVCARFGGPFDLGYRLDLGETTPVGAPPETEDRAFDPLAVRHTDVCDPDTFWALLQNSAVATLRAAFGPDLQPTGHTCAVDRGRGVASLATVRPRVRVLHLNDQGALRMRLADGELSVDLPVTDLRFYEDDFSTVRHWLVEYVREAVQDGWDMMLSVGLTRPWTRPGDDQPRHWLQVNNVFLRHNPFLPEAEHPT
jgi:hypothetical protein